MSAVEIGQMIAAEIQDAYAKGLRDGYANALSQIGELRAENEASRTQIDADTDEIAAWQAENDTLRARVERLTYALDTAVQERLDAEGKEHAQ